MRRYADEPVPEDALQSLRRAIDKAEPLDPRVEVGISLLSYEEIGNRSAVGTFFLHTPAPWYLVMHAPPHPARMEEIGFRGEQVILTATALGLGTCWIGDTFRSHSIAPHLGQSPESLVAISPLGFPGKGRMRAVARSLSRNLAANRGKTKPLEEIAFWQRWEEPVTAGAAVPAEVMLALEAARLAPSWSNVQPWYFLLSETFVLAMVDGRPQRGNDKPGKPYYRLDAGIAMAHFWLVMRQQGYDRHWEPLKDEEFEAKGALATPPHAIPVGRYMLQNADLGLK